MKTKPLSADKLRNTVNPKVFKFKSTEDVRPLSGVIGQERAVKAIEFGLGMKGHGYNIFVTGLSGTGKATIVERLLRQLAVTDKGPDDWLFVHNFSEPDQPHALSIPMGKGNEFESDMSAFIESLKIELPKAFNDKYYEQHKESTLDEFEDKRNVVLRRLENYAKRHKVVIQNTSIGQRTIPLIDDREMSPEEYDALPKTARRKLDKIIDQVQIKLSAAVKEITLLENKTQEKLIKLNETVAKYAVNKNLESFKKKYSYSEAIQDYLGAVEKNIVANVGDFVSQKEERGNLLGLHIPQSQPSFTKYKVNVVSSNKNAKCAPVIVETNPTYHNLFGRIEKKAQFGALVTDFTLIKAGSLLRANGGYLLVDIESVLNHPYVWDTLKRTLRNRKLQIEDLSEELGFVSTVGLKPEPIPLDVKVVLLGRADIFHSLEFYDETFRKTFKVRADFDNSMKLDRNSYYQYASFISKVCREENLLHYDPSGVAAIIEHAQRSISDQLRASIQFGHLVNTLREANYIAENNNKKLVSAIEVEAAIHERRFRSNLVEEKFRNQIQRDIIALDLSKKIVGQVNGLAVYQAGDHSFGIPARITASTFAGKGNVIQIEREVKMSGSTHDKGVFTLSSYLSRTFAENIPISLSASITFEQNYSFIDGDSASSTELYALLSALSSLPINQAIAVTGSVDQRGNVQAIGGVNQKIEGFFDVCLQKGLTGNQGVMIPASNVQHMMVRKDIMEVVRSGLFNIWPVKTIEEGIEVLTGVPAGKRKKNGKFPPGTVYRAIQNRLINHQKESLKFKQNLKKELGISKENEKD
ncbi:MAG: AAA family ATPase [Candidatus Marinimicrobia bacterium]|nr:AAA family ATPase [Candidatus Neomarinimicrobiota bacterium]